MRIISCVRAGLAAFVLALTLPVAATESRTACIFDPLGADGFIYPLFRDYIAVARTWGYDLTPRAYTDESVVAGDLKAGKCDLAVITGVRTRQFVKFAGSLDMAAGIQNYTGLRRAIDAMSGEKAAPLMREDGYEVVGVVPIGKVYLLSRDREDLANLDRLAGKRIAVLGYDRASLDIAAAAGASPLPSSVATLGPRFNNGSADMTYAPAIAIAPLELTRGLRPNGGIADFVLGTVSGQVVIHRERFDAEFGMQSRRWIFAHLFDRVLERSREAESALPDSLWVEVADNRRDQYLGMFRRVRQQLWESGWYSHRMQRLLKKIRCANTPSLAECTLDTEGGPIH